MCPLRAVGLCGVWSKHWPQGILITSCSWLKCQECSRDVGLDKPASMWWMGCYGHHCFGGGAECIKINTPWESKDLRELIATTSQSQYFTAEWQTLCKCWVSEDGVPLITSKEPRDRPWSPTIYKQLSCLLWPGRSWLERSELASWWGSWPYHMCVCVFVCARTHTTLRVRAKLYIFEGGGPGFLSMTMIGWFVWGDLRGYNTGEFETQERNGE